MAKIENVPVGTIVSYLDTPLRVAGRHEKTGRIILENLQPENRGQTFVRPETEIIVVNATTKFEVGDLEFGTVVFYNGLEWTIVEGRNTEVVTLKGKHTSLFLPFDAEVTLKI